MTNFVSEFLQNFSLRENETKTKQHTKNASRNSTLLLTAATTQRNKLEFVPNQICYWIHYSDCMDKVFERNMLSML